MIESAVIVSVLSAAGWIGRGVSRPGTWGWRVADALDRLQFRADVMKLRRKLVAPENALSGRRWSR